MDYVEQIKKVNALAKQLQTHGLAESIEEAIRQAQQMIEKGEDVSRFFEEAESIKLAAEEENMENNSIKNIEKRMDSFEEKINKQISGLISKMNEIIAEINKIEDQMKKMKAESQTRPAPAPASPAATPAANHPRSGNLTSEDVSIEKYFNFGKKR